MFLRSESCCYQAWLLKNSICLKTDPKGVTRNLSEIGENRHYERMCNEQNWTWLVVPEAFLAKFR